MRTGACTCVNNYIHTHTRVVAAAAVNALHAECVYAHITCRGALSLLSLLYCTVCVCDMLRPRHQVKEIIVLRVCNRVVARLIHSVPITRLLTVQHRTHSLTLTLDVNNNSMRPFIICHGSDDDDDDASHTFPYV